MMMNGVSMFFAFRFYPHQARRTPFAFQSYCRSRFGCRRNVSQAQKALNAPTNNADTKTETLRLPAGQLFEKRHYMFTAVRNIRSYEWSTKETEDLYDDIFDEVFHKKEPRDFELQQIVLVPAEWDKKKYGVGNLYDIYDGQQRLVTFSLLYAAIRDSLRAYENQQETIKELSGMLNPQRARKDPILRIELRQREGAMLRKILIPDLTDDELRVDLPTPKCRGNLTETDQLVINNYELLLKNVDELSIDEKLTLFDYLQESVYFLVCSSNDASIARNMVMGQGKGKNNEPIDDFKGLVCFRAILSENDQEEVFQKWDELVSLDMVGRDNVAAACQLLASAQLRKKVKKNDEIDILEEWLKSQLEVTYENGKEFYYKVVDPACRILASFRGDAIDAASFEGANGNDSLQRSISMRLAFLRAASGVPTAKEIEIAVLHQLFQGLPAETLENCLKQLEVVALYMMLIKPSPAKRHRLVFDLLDSFDAKKPEPSLLREMITQDEFVQMRKALEIGTFGSNVPGKKIASAILERLSAHELCERFQSSMPQCAHMQLEHILPKKAEGEYWTRHWSDADLRMVWTHRLGNLAPLNQRANVKASNKSFSSKKDLYKESPYPLTSSLQKYDVWDPEAVENRHKEILHSSYEVWGL
jgi:hypothetical protein